MDRSVDAVTPARKKTRRRRSKTSDTTRLEASGLTPKPTSASAPNSRTTIDEVVHKVDSGSITDLVEAMTVMHLEEIEKKLKIITRGNWRNNPSRNRLSRKES